MRQSRRANKTRAPVAARLGLPLLLLLLLAAAPPRAAAARALVSSLSPSSGEDEPTARLGASLADDPTAPLPSGQGPLYATTSAMARAIEGWASKGLGLEMLEIADPLDLAPGDARGSPSYGAALTAARFTDGSVPAEGKRRAVLTCSTHARELITGETCFALVRLLAGASADGGGDGDGGAATDEAAANNDDADDPSAPLWRWAEMREAMRAAGLVTRAESASAASARLAFRAVAARVSKELDLTILPVVNAAGRDLIEEEGRYALRKTVDARAPDASPSVDPNRSYPWNWKGAPAGAYAAEASETYPGPNSAWPWEVRAVAALLANEGGAAGAGAKAQLDAAVDVHSGIHALLFPYGYTCDLSGVPTAHVERWQRAADAATAAFGDVIVGPTASALYVAAGTTSEYAYGALGAVLAATPEIYSGSGDGRNQACPRLGGWVAGCGAGAQEASILGVCACAAGTECRNKNDGGQQQEGQQEQQRQEQQQEQEQEQSDARTSSPLPSSSSPSSTSRPSRYGGGELTPAVVLLEAQILRASGAADEADAAEAGAAAALGLDVPAARAALAAAAAASFRQRGPGGSPDPEEANSAHYQPGKWPADLPLGVDLADAIQMGEPVRNAGEPWYARDSYLRHWPDVSPGARATFAFFNPTGAAEYRRTVSDYAAGILAMLLAA